jgi:hypothetical protein
MAQTAWPFENIDTNETQFSQWARNIGEGVISGRGFELEPFGDSSGMVVKVKAGQALIRGHYYDNTAEVSLTIPAANLTNPRIDRIVLRLDPLANTVLLTVLEGTPAASPVPPALEASDSQLYDLLLADVAVAAAAATIAPADVTDQRLIFEPWSPEVQAAIDAAKQDVITGAASTVTSTNLTASRAVVSNSSGKIAAASVTSTELGHLAGATGNIQTQLNDRLQLAAGGTVLAKVIVDATSTISAGAEWAQVPLQLNSQNATGQNPGISFNSAGSSAMAIWHPRGTSQMLIASNGGVVSTTNGQPSIRNITLSTGDPTGGSNGDVWLKYS